MAGDYFLYADRLYTNSQPQLLFTDNDTNTQRLFDRPNDSGYVKDAFHRHVVDDERDVVNPANEGTKDAAWYRCQVPPQGLCMLRQRLSATALATPFDDFETLVDQRVAEAEAFYSAIQRPDVGLDQRKIQRQALAGMIWTKQFFYYNMEQ